MRFELLIAGMGGQGILLAGTIVGTAVSVHGGLNATQIVSYGPEARGGRVYTEVVLSDEEIDYPRVRKADFVIVMSQRAYDEFARRVKRGGVVIYDPDLVEPHDPPEGAELLPVPATRTAERLGMRRSANMVMVGFLTAICDLLRPEDVEKAIAHRMRPEFVEVNLRAFREGYEMGLSARGESTRGGSA